MSSSCRPHLEELVVHVGHQHAVLRRVVCDHHQQHACSTVLPSESVACRLAGWCVSSSQEIGHHIPLLGARSQERGSRLGAKETAWALGLSFHPLAQEAAPWTALRWVRQPEEGDGIISGSPAQPGQVVSREGSGPCPGAAGTLSQELVEVALSSPTQGRGPGALKG